MQVGTRLGSPCGIFHESTSISSANFLSSTRPAATCCSYATKVLPSLLDDVNVFPGRIEPFFLLKQYIYILQSCPGTTVVYSTCGLVFQGQKVWFSSVISSFSHLLCRMSLGDLLSHWTILPWPMPDA